MNILVLLKMVPDVVEELEIAPDGKSLDTSFLRLIVSERDDHALEEALLLKERYGGAVTALALDAPGVDDVLFTTLAKGADRALKVSGVEMLTTSATAALLAQLLPNIPGLLPVDLILTGVQAIDDLDGLVAPMLARLLGLPYLGVVSQVVVDPATRTATVVKEYAGGVRGEFEISLPAVLGIQSAEKPPRYVPVAKVRTVMKEKKIETVPAPAFSQPTMIEVLQMAKPQPSERAQILEGSPEEVASKICELLAARGLLKG